MSIRLRLLAATLALVAMGLFVAGGATYGLLRSFLTERIDRQLVSARAGAGAALAQERLGRRGPFPHRGPRPGVHVEEGLAGPVALLLDPLGNVVSSAHFGFHSFQPPPSLPPKLPGSQGYLGEDMRFFSTEAAGSELRYRALATPASNRRGTVVVALPLANIEVTLRRLLVFELLVSAVVLVGVGVLALWVVRLGLRPLEAMAITADGIAGGDLTKRVEPSDSKTEVGRLGLALNAMLQRIEAAFAEQKAAEGRLRRFVADASHELRTPLTSIRGYAELFRREADLSPEDLAKTMRRIEEESGRMGKLVDELLLLARLDQGRPLDRGPVDLARLTADAVADARASAPERPIDLESPERLIIEGDEERLRQVAANLLSNAVAHTPEGSPIHVRLGEMHGMAALEVADEGPGIAPDERDRVFDRFYKVDASRKQAGGGMGLGLAIVASVVEAHGGRVELVSASGQGARFLVNLPLGRAYEQAADEGRWR